MLLPYLKVKTGFEEYLIHRQLWDDLCQCYEERSQCIPVQILQYKQKMWQKTTKMKSLNLWKYACKLGREERHATGVGEGEVPTYQNLKKPYFENKTGLRQGDYHQYYLT
jgi:hypothetical protein